MTLHYNRKNVKRRRRELRQDSMLAERILWNRLRNRKFLNLKFRRQYSVDFFILDFYCPELKLAIEVDGDIHEKGEVKNKDENREGFLNQLGIKIIRIKNSEVYKIDMALAKLEKEIKQLYPLLFKERAG